MKIFGESNNNLRADFIDFIETELDNINKLYFGIYFFCKIIELFIAKKRNIR